MLDLSNWSRQIINQQTLESHSGNINFSYNSYPDVTIQNNWPNDSLSGNRTDLFSINCLTNTNNKTVRWNYPVAKGDYLINMNLWT